MSAIRVAGLGKAYKQYPTRWSRLAEWTLPFLPPRHKLHWVLRDVAFNVPAGEAMGIVGDNGAGKSTLLKLIAGTTQPTTGEIGVSGRVAALLELGMGFHPEFTGRQNAFMAAQLLGLGPEEIQALMPRIESFAEIGEYIDQPVRVYSSGMMVRLAFSVATARRPDILIVDEALAVGDAYFQHKSLERIRQMRSEGTTLLLVSHDRAAVRAICGRALLLDAGKALKEGATEEVMDYYNAHIAERGTRTVRQYILDGGKVQTVSGTGEARIANVMLLDEHGGRIEDVHVGQPVSLMIEVDVRDDLPELVVGYVIKDRFGQQVYGTNTHHLGRPLERIAKGERIGLRFGFDANLGEGTYSVAVALHTGVSHVGKNYEWRDLAMIFRMLAPPVGRFEGVAWLPPRLEIQR